MAEERIDIVVTQRGSREVKRDLESIGTGAASSIPGVDKLKAALQQIGGSVSLAVTPAGRLQDAMSKLGIGAELGAKGLLRMSTALSAAQTAMETTWGVTVRLRDSLASLSSQASGGAGLPALASAASSALGPLASVGTALVVIARESTAVIRQLNLIRGSFEQLRVSGGGAQTLLFDAASMAKDITPNLNGVGQASQTAATGFRNLAGGAGGAVPPVNGLGQALGGAGAAANNAHLSFFKLWRIMLALTIIRQVVSAVFDASDAWTMMSNKLNQVSTDSLNLVMTQEAVYAAAQRTRSGLDDIATLYTRTSMATEKLGLSQKEVLGITETVAKAMKLNGGSVQETANAMRQLSQAFNKGKLDGDEFRSIMENAPQLQKLFADSLGVTKGELMAMSKNGTLTLEKLIAAIQKGGPAIDAAFGKLLPTIAEGFQNVGNAFTRFIGHMNEATGFSRGFYNMMTLIANNIDIIMAALAVLGVGVIVAFGPAVVSMIVAFGASVALALGPIGWVVAGLSAVAAGILVWRGRTMSATDAAIAHRTIIEQVKQAYIDSQGAVQNWADTIEGATRSQVLASLQSADDELSKLRQNALSPLGTGQLFDLTTGVISGDEASVQLNRLIQTFKDGGLEVKLYKAELEKLKAAYPQVPSDVILALENYADTTVVAEENSKKLHAAWVLMGENVPDIVKRAAENVLGIQSIFDKLTGVTNLSGSAGGDTLGEQMKRDNATAQELLATKQSELAVTMAIAQYGEDSIQVANLRMAAEQAVVERQLAGLHISVELHDQIMNAVRVQSMFNNGPMSASIQNAVSWVKTLADKLRVAIGLKAVFGGTGNGMGSTAEIGSPTWQYAQYGTGHSAMAAATNPLYNPPAVPDSPDSPGAGTGGGAIAKNLKEADSLAKVQEEMQKEANMLRLSNSERAIQADLLQKVDRLRQAGITLSPLETAQLEAGIRKMAALKEQTELFGSAIDRVMSGATDAIVSFVKDGKVNFGDLITSMISDIARLAAQQYITKPLTNMLNSVVGNLFGEGGSLFSAAAAPAPAYATGGSFIVGGSGGVDSQTVKLRASPGERVSVTRRGQGSEGAGSGVTNVFNITTPDVKGFKASETQIAARMARITSRGTRNN